VEDHEATHLYSCPLTLILRVRFFGVPIAIIKTLCPDLSKRPEKVRHLIRTPILFKKSEFYVEFVLFVDFFNKINPLAKFFLSNEPSSFDSSLAIGSGFAPSILLQGSRNDPEIRQS
jgi:hypothetical protein